MTTNYTSLQSRVQTRVIDLPSSVLAEIPFLVNEAINALQQVHNFQVMKAENQYTTNISASNAHIIGQIPTNWKEPRGNPYFVLNQGSVREMDWAANRLFAYRQFDPFDPNVKGPPRLLLLGEATNATVSDPSNPDLQNVNLNIETYPYPDGQSDWTTAPAGEYRINVPYWGFLPQLVSGTDINWFSNNAVEFIIDFATSRAFMLNWDEARAAAWYAQAWGPKYDGFSQTLIGGWARKAINLDKSMAYAPLKFLRARRDVYAEADQWRT